MLVKVTKSVIIHSETSSVPKRKKEAITHEKYNLQMDSATKAFISGDMSHGRLNYLAIKTFDTVKNKHIDAYMERLYIQ